ncbi:hypothetical protein JCM10908_003817 [Rhodotorula pacifica]|uniref:cupin-like domain-containing protein n=1 Tax=Rhodotorula pacifica TaxID=1495444 RepID=UPI0031763140
MSTERALRRYVRDYQSLNASAVTELETVPSPLDFARFVAANRPCVIRGGARYQQLPALDRWTDEYLIEKLAEKALRISATPSGNADAIVDGVFVEPAEVEMPLSQLLAYLATERDDPESSSPVYYLQSQNGNMADEYTALADDAGRDGPAFAREYFGEAPEVANIWIGGRRSRTSLHKDPYENIYTVVRGSKTFTLLPPSEAYCMHEQMFPHGRYTFDAASSTFAVERTSPELNLPWIPIDPLAPDLARHPRYALARPMRVTLQAGDQLYLPAMWYHFVEQDIGWGPEGPGKGVQAAIAVNHWFDVRMDGHLWSLCMLQRRLLLALDGREDEDPDSSDGEDET